MSIYLLIFRNIFLVYLLVFRAYFTLFFSSFFTIFSQNTRKSIFFKDKKKVEKLNFCQNLFLEKRYFLQLFFYMVTVKKCIHKPKCMTFSFWFFVVLLYYFKNREYGYPYPPSPPYWIYFSILSDFFGNIFNVFRTEHKLSE